MRARVPSSTTWPRALRRHVVARRVAGAGECRRRFGAAGVVASSSASRVRNGSCFDRRALRRGDVELVERQLRHRASTAAWWRRAGRDSHRPSTARAASSPRVRPARAPCSARPCRLAGELLCQELLQVPPDILHAAATGRNGAPATAASSRKWWCERELSGGRDRPGSRHLDRQLGAGSAHTHRVHRLYADEYRPGGTPGTSSRAAHGNAADVDRARRGARLEHARRAIQVARRRSKVTPSLTTAVIPVPWTARYVGGVPAMPGPGPHGPAYSTAAFPTSWSACGTRSNSPSCSSTSGSGAQFYLWVRYFERMGDAVVRAAPALASRAGCPSPR